MTVNVNDRWKPLWNPHLKVSPLSEMRKISALHMVGLESETFTAEVLPTAIRLPH
jgi:hypothetical protein